jgi:16S rRNA (cytosine967-C5)-methyltransferase
VISPARWVSYNLLWRIELKGIFSDDAIHSKAVAELDSRDRKLVTELVYGTLRWQLLLDHVLGRASTYPWGKVDIRVRIVLRMGLYQLWYMDRIPDHALVHDAVELAKRECGKGAAGLVNGVLRGLIGSRPWLTKAYERECPPWVRVSLPRWIWDRWVRRYGEEEVRQYALSLNSPPQCAARLGFEEPEPGSLPPGAVASDLVPGAYLLETAREVHGFQWQDEASQLIPELLGGCAGWKIWDVCAAPGGKSAILCRMCGDSGLVVSSDLRWSRARRMAATLKAGDGAKASPLIANALHTPPFRADFDAILVDAPCSGLGTLRRNPEIKWRFQPERLASLQHRQVKMLRAVAGSVRIGGLLLYSTCSTEPEENEQVVDAFLGSHSGFCLQRPDQPPGVEPWLDSRGMLRTFPSARRWDGFYAALMARKS